MIDLGYIIGSDPGAFHIARQASPEQAMQLAGLYRKAMSVIRHGVNFVQLPLESISEFQEPDLEENMKKVREMGISYGIHGETHALGGEAMQLDSALQDTYIRVHQKVEVMLRESGKLQSKYVLLHSSESPGFLHLGMQLQPTMLVDFWGRPLSKFLEKERNSEEVVNWAIRRPEVMSIAGHRYLRNPNFYRYVEDVKNEYRNEILTKERPDVPAEILSEVGNKVQEARKRLGLGQNESLPLEEFEKIVNEVLNSKVPSIVEKNFKSILKSFFEVADLTYGSERVAYFIIARWMEITKDPLWEKITNTSVEYYAKLAGKSKEEWLKENRIEKLSMDDPEFIARHTLWFPAVSAKYIWGHFSQDKNPDKGSDPRIRDLKEILKKYNMPFVIESPMVSEEEASRLPNPLQMYHLVKILDEDGKGLFGIALDIEHMLMANINPEVVFNLFPPDGGKYVLVIHSGWPSPLGPAHIPIPLGSEQQQYLYKMYYLLRKKGMGIERDTYIIFERGGGEDPYKQSFLALRNIVEFLKKDVPPDQLPPEFYGISTEQILSIERQRVAIKEHALEPLRGLITVPEEEHGVLGRAAIEKGKRPEEWAKERYR